jgi:hypothetical protein
MHVRNLALALLLSATTALCQVHSQKESQHEKGDLYAGYNYISNDSGFTAPNIGATNGWKVGGDIKAYKWLAISGEFAMGSGKVTNASSNTYTFLFGPRFFVPIHKTPHLTPYVDFLVGGTEVSIGNSPDSLKSSAGFTSSLDGGIDYRFARRFSWRAQFGYLYSTKITHINDQIQNVANPPVWHFSAFTGPTFRF